MCACLVWSGSRRFCHRLVWGIADVEGSKKPAGDDYHYRLDDFVAPTAISKSLQYFLSWKGRIGFGSCHWHRFRHCGSFRTNLRGAIFPYTKVALNIVTTATSFFLTSALNPNAPMLTRL